MKIWGRGGVNFRSYDFFGFVASPTGPVKLHGKKKKQKQKFRFSVHSNGMSTTCKFFSLRKKSLCRVYVTQSSLEGRFHVARDMSSELEFRCIVVYMSQFHCGNEVKQGH